MRKCVYYALTERTQQRNREGTEMRNERNLQILMNATTGEERYEMVFVNKKTNKQYMPAHIAHLEQVRLYSLNDDTGEGDITISEEEFCKDYFLKPNVGTGCTECLYTDSHACTITKVSPSGKTIWYRRDRAKVVSGSAMDGSAEYEYEFDENGYDEKATLRKGGIYRATGTDFYIAIGVRREYYDPHF